MDCEKVKEYLCRCDKGAVFPALKSNLDIRCYYAYLEEVESVLTGINDDLAKEYGDRKVEAHTVLVARSKNSGGTFDYEKTFSIQREFIWGILRLIEDEFPFGDIANVVRAQLDFAMIQLCSQSRVLSAIAFTVGSEAIAKYKSERNGYWRSMEGAEALFAEVESVRRRCFGGA